MKTIVLVLALAFAATPASAQFWNWQTLQPGQPLPKTITLQDNDGKIIGTATAWGNRISYRDPKGEYIGTQVFEKDGTKNFYDPNGKLMTSTTFEGKIGTIRNSEGEITGTSTIEPDGSTTFRDATGQVVGSSTVDRAKK